ncbi:hypothetical protein C8J57DRAFT_1229029 [Mycena rebaudengoi]|nr:hypothetical protein C8J57DRAFT_1229029 [Mycena rebaudengoi]
MRSLSILATLFAFSAPSVVLAGSCIAFDASWNLLAFGLNGKDYNAGPSTSWASGTAADITTQGRPPFDGADTKCYLAQFFNAIYVLGADKSKPSDVYMYDAGAKSWSTQAITAGGFDPSSFEAILDHDTNVFYAVSKGELWSLSLEQLKAAQSAPIAWVDQSAAGITTTNYDPVMAIAQNHIHFFGVPGNPAGSASIFVIHFSFWQPGSQSYSSDFPDTHGQATSFFKDSGVQEEMVFIPDDGSKTYVVNVETNTTQTLAGPPTVDAGARYFASTNSLVQLTSSGAISFLPYTAGSASANSAAAWGPIKNLAAVSGTTPAGPDPNNSSSSGGKSTSKGGAAGGSPSKTSGGPSDPTGSGAARRDTVLGSSAALFAVGAAVVAWL